MSKTRGSQRVVSVTVKLALDLTQGWDPHSMLAHHLGSAGKALEAGDMPPCESRMVAVEALSALANAVHAKGSRNGVKIIAQLADVNSRKGLADKLAIKRAMELFRFPGDRLRAVTVALSRIRKARKAAQK